MKKCTKCGEEKLLKEFYKDVSQKSGLTARCIACFQSYRDENKEKQRKYMRNLREANREEINRRKRLGWRTSPPEKRMFLQAKNRAKRKGIEFNISLEDIKVPEVCPLLNLPFFPGTKGNYRQTPSLDRIDSNKGYIKGNVWVISNRANTMKTDALKEELLVFALNIIKKFGNDDIVRTMWKHIESEDKEPLR